MKKLFTFAAAILASVAMMAADKAPSSSFDISAVTSENWGTWTKGTPVLDANGFHITGFMARNSAGQAWVGYLSGNTTSSSPVWTAPEGSHSLGGAAYGEETSYMTMRTDRVMYFRVTGCTEAYALVATQNNGQRQVTLSAYEYTDSRAAEATATATSAAEGNNIEEISISGLDASKVYEIVVAGTASGNANFYEICFGSGSIAPSEDPVESAEISGKNACLIGGSVTLTCNAAKATTYQWSMNGAAIDGATAKTYVFEPTAAGSFSFTCAASNAYNVNPVVAEAFVVTVADPENVCGELIKATHTGGKTATVTGVLGGTADKNTQDNGKLGSNGHYFGVKLASGNFQAADEVTIVASALSGGNTATIYSDKGTTLLGSADFDTESMTATFTLEAEAEWIYVYRTSSACNPNIEYIAVNRSCEASNNADIKKVWVMAGEEEMVFEPEEDGVTYNLVVPASVDMAQLSINYTLAHPKASANVASPFVIIVPAAGAAANSQVVVVTAQDGTQKTYTFNVTKSAAASTDASLKSLAVTGFTLDPAFAADVFTYTITKAYGAENPGTDKVVCEPNDATAHPNVAAGENALIVTVTAEDGETQLIYTINIVEAAAKKALLEAAFSNGVHGFILNGNIDVPYLAGEAEPTFVSARFWQPDGEPTAEIVEGNLVVTGIDGQFDTYTITYVPVTPMEVSYEEITFENVPSYIYSVYDYDANKGVKFSKDVEEATNHRISEGKDRIYLALPAAQNVKLTSGTGAERPVRIWVNGTVVADKVKTPAANAQMTINLDPTQANFVGIESNDNNGDAGFIKMQLERPWATAIENAEEAVKAVKFFENGQLMIEKNGVIYNAQGAIVK